MSTRRGPWGDLGLILLAAALVGACWLAWGCGERAAAAVVGAGTSAVVKAAPAAPEPTSTASADDQLKSERQARRELADQLDAKDRRIEGLEHDRADLVDQDLKRGLAWISGLVLIGVLASVGLWFVLPAGFKAWAVYGALGCIAVSAAALGLRALVPYREVIGLVLVAGGAAFGLWKLARLKRAAAQGAGAFDRLEESFVGMKDWIAADKHALIDDLVDDVKRKAAADQDDAGVRRLLAGIRQRPVPPAATVPA